MSKIYFFVLIINIFYVNEIFNQGELVIEYPQTGTIIFNESPFAYGFNANSPPNVQIVDSLTQSVFFEGVAAVDPGGNWGIQTNVAIPSGGAFLVTAYTQEQRSEATFINSSSNFISLFSGPMPAIESLVDPNASLTVMGSTMKNAEITIAIIEDNSQKVMDEIKTMSNEEGKFAVTFQQDSLEKSKMYDVRISSLAESKPSNFEFKVIANSTNEMATNKPFVPVKPLVPDQNTVLDSGAPGFLGTTVPFSNVTFTIEPPIKVEFIQAATTADEHGHYKIQISKDVTLVPGKHKLIISITTPKGKKFAGKYFLTVPTTAEDNLTKAIVNKYGCKT